MLSPVLCGWLCLGHLWGPPSSPFLPPRGIGQAFTSAACAPLEWSVCRVAGSGLRAVL